MSVEVRPARAADVEAIREVAERAWHAAHAPIVGPDRVEAFLEEFYDADSFRSLIADDATIVDVAADEGGTVVGFTAAGPSEDSPATFDLDRIYVRPDRWGEGIGGRLLDRVEREASRRGGERVELGVMAENERAVRFYESAGYRRVDEVYDDFVDATSYVYAKDV